jgi:hypothetical protein
LAGLASAIALSRRSRFNMHLWKMPKKASGRDQKCALLVEMFPGKEGRENSWAQIGISVCVLLLPPVLAIAAVTAHAPRLGSGDTPAVFEPLAESPSTSLPITEGRFGLPSRPPKLSGIGPTQFDDRFPKDASIPPPQRLARNHGVFATEGDVAAGQQRVIDTSSVAFGGGGQVMHPSAEAKGIMAKSRAEPEIQTTPSQPAARLDIKSGNARSLLTTAGTSAHQVSNPNGADAVVDAQSTSRVHTSTCLPSASAVRQDNPGAWPSWTLRALGHEGTKCWYAGTRATAHNH